MWLKWLCCLLTKASVNSSIPMCYILNAKCTFLWNLIFLWITYEIVIFCPLYFSPRNIKRCICRGLLYNLPLTSNHFYSIKYSFMLTNDLDIWMSVKMPSTVVTWSKAWTIMTHSNIGAAVSNPTRSMHVHSVLVLSCMWVAALHQTNLPSKGSYQLWIGARNYKSGQIPIEECRATIIKMYIKVQKQIIKMKKITNFLCKV